jgi:hypothetical protein
MSFKHSNLLNNLITLPLIFYILMLRCIRFAQGLNIDITSNSQIYPNLPKVLDDVVYSNDATLIIQFKD